MIINGIDTKDISVVVQGAVDKNITPLCLASIRKHLPEAEIVLSTWEGTDVDGLDFDQVMLNKDPGAFPCDEIQNSIMNNINRQILSTYNGLLKSSNQYAVKIRSDFFLNGNGFMNYFRKYLEYNPEFRFLKERIVGCTVYSRNPRSHIYPLVMPYCPSDFFFFGLREDLIQLFDRELICDVEEKMFFELHPENRKYLNYKESLCQYMPEQSIWMGFLQKHIRDLDCICRDHVTEKNTVLTESSFANNLVLCSAEQLEIGTYKTNLFSKGIPENCITHQDWIDLYLYYCLGDKRAFTKYLRRTRTNDVKFKLNKTDRAWNALELQKPHAIITDLNMICELTEKYDYISFDIFDTLIFRRTAPDWQALAQTSEYISMLLSSNGVRAHVAEIDYLRNNYASFSGQIHISSGGSNEYKIRDIIASILRHFGVSEEKNPCLCEQIVKNELEREMCSIVLNKEALATLKKLKENGKKIIAISDMYFSEKDIRSILEHVGILDYFEKIFVSSEFNMTKADGKLYKQVVKELKIEPNNILHIGDNLHSDIAMAKKNGIFCVHYNNSANSARKFELEQQVIGNNPKKYIEKSLKILDDCSVDFCDFIKNYFSFDIINFVYDLSRKMHKENIKRVFFLERDGSLYGKIYKELSNKLIILKGLPVIESKNLKLSRKDTACLINITEVKDVVERAYRVNPPNRFHIIHILGCFGISISEFDKDLQNEIVNHNSDPFFFNKIYPKYIYPLLAKKRETTISYLEDNGFFEEDRVAIVDIGWGGTSQLDIKAYLSLNYKDNICYGFYYASDDRARSLAPYYSGYHYGPDLFFAYSLLEFIVKNYSDNYEILKQNCESNPYMSATYRLNYEARSQILDDVDCFVESVNQLHLTPEQIRQVTFPRLKKIIDNPPKEFLLQLKDVRFSLDRKRDDEYKPLFDSINTLSELQRQYETAMWVQASMQISTVSIHRKLILKGYYHKIVFSRHIPNFIKRPIKFIAAWIKRKE